MRIGIFFGASMAAVGVASMATAASLEIDINAATLKAYNASGQATTFNSSFTSGTLQLIAGNAWLDDVQIGGQGQDFDEMANVTSLSGTLAIANIDGVSEVTSGSFNVQLADGSVISSYACSLTGDSGSIEISGGVPSALAPIATETFGSTQFAGIDVTDWATAQAVAASLRVAPEPGLNSVADVDVYIEAPEPASLGLFALAGMGLLIRRARRH